MLGDVVEDAEQPGRFILTVPEGGSRAEVVFRFPEAAKYSSLRARARVLFSDVTRGKYAWLCTRACLFQRDAKGKWMPAEHGIVSGWGTSLGKRAEVEIEMLPNAAFADFCLQQSGTSGMAVFEDLFLQPVVIRSSFLGWRLVFIAAWVGAGFYYFPRCRLHRRRLRVLIFLNALAILFGALMPGDWIKESTEKVEQAIHRYRQKSEERPAPTLSKERPSPKKDKPEDESLVVLTQVTHGVGHFTLFATLCFLVYLSAALERQHPVYFLKVGLDVLLFAAITESLQFLTIDRSAHPNDLLIDVYGMGVAFVVFLCLLPVVRKTSRMISKKSVEECL